MQQAQQKLNFNLFARCIPLDKPLTYYYKVRKKATEIRLEKQQTHSTKYYWGKKNLYQNQENHEYIFRI